MLQVSATRRSWTAASHVLISSCSPECELMCCRAEAGGGRSRQHQSAGAPTHHLALPLHRRSQKQPTSHQRKKNRRHPAMMGVTMKRRRRGCTRYVLQSRHKSLGMWEYVISPHKYFIMLIELHLHTMHLHLISTYT